MRRAKVKVAFFVHCFFPDHFYGTETYTLSVAKNLVHFDCSPVVVSALFAGEPGKKELVTQYEYDNIPVYCIDKNRIPHRRIAETYYQKEMYEVLKAILLDIDPDLVHVTHLGNHTAVLIDVLSDLGIPAVATLTDFFGFCSNSRLQAVDGSLCSGPDRSRKNCVACTLNAVGRSNASKWYYRLLSRPAVALVAASVLSKVNWGKLAEIVNDLVERPDLLAQRYSYYSAAVAPTRFLASAYKSNGLEVPLHEMHFGVDVSRARKPSIETSCALRFGFIGQLSPHKGADILIEAFRELPDGRARLSIYGDSSGMDDYVVSLKRSANGLPVEFCGTFVSGEIDAVFAELDFLIIPSRWYENSPLVLLSSLACHTPVIVSDVDGMSEFVEHGRNGFLFERENVDSLREIFIELIDDPEAARVMSVGTDFPRTTREMTHDLIDVYKTAVENAAPSVKRKYC